MGALTELVAKQVSLHKEMAELGKGALAAAFAEFFASHPEAQSVVWRQYTPYFNDGDACTFGVHPLELHVDASAMEDDVRAYVEERKDDDDGYSYGGGSALDALSYISGSEKGWKPYRFTGKRRPLTRRESSLLSDFLSLEKQVHAVPELLKIAFGDHVTVTATPSGIEAQECRHD